MKISVEIKPMNTFTIYSRVSTMPFTRFCIHAIGIAISLTPAADGTPNTPLIRYP